MTNLSLEQTSHPGTRCARSQGAVQAVAGRGLAAPDWVQKILWPFLASGVGAALALRAGADTALMSAGAATSALALAALGQRRRQILKWMPVLLMLCGLNMGQSNLIAAVIATFFEHGVILSPCPSARPQDPRPGI